MTSEQEYIQKKIASIREDWKEFVACWDSDPDDATDDALLVWNDQVWGRDDLEELISAIKTDCDAFELESKIYSYIKRRHEEHNKELLKDLKVRCFNCRGYIRALSDSCKYCSTGVQWYTDEEDFYSDIKMADVHPIGRFGLRG